MNNQFKNFQTIGGNLETNTKRKFDLEERTARFAENIINILKKIPNTPINKRMIEQLMGSAGSLGANYCEANESESKSDFIHKISICKKETKETKHWIRLLAYANPNLKNELRTLWKEAEELLLIFSAINRSSKKRV